MFLFKKIVSQFLFPLPLGSLLLIVGLALLWSGRRRVLGRVAVTLGTAVLIASSYGVVSGPLLIPLETRYPSYDALVAAGALDLAPEYVVVLGGGHSTDPRVPATAQLSENSLVRLVEGIRIQREHPHSVLVLSGGTVFDPLPEAETMFTVARQLGVDADDVLVEAGSRDTKDQARIIGSIVGEEPFVLVTSAAHMPRSMALFAKRGLQPIPAPTGHLLKGSAEPGAGLHPGDFFPNGRSLRMTETAIYEYLGIAWGWLRGLV